MDNFLSTSKRSRRTSRNRENILKSLVLSSSNSLCFTCSIIVKPIENVDFSDRIHTFVEFHEVTVPQKDPYDKSTLNQPHTSKLFATATCDGMSKELSFILHLTQFCHHFYRIRLPVAFKTCGSSKRMNGLNSNSSPIVICRRELCFHWQISPSCQSRAEFCKTFLLKRTLDRVYSWPE